MNMFDYIVVGAGTAGCIVARRLSEDGQHRVLLLEAGGADRSPWFKLPAGYVKTYHDPACNWMYESVPQAQLMGRRLYAPRGKVQGGSGSINAMIYVRGHAQDFNDWRAAGNPGWGFDDVLPTFRDLESHPGGDTEWRGGKGPIGITPMRQGAHPICQDFLSGLKELGLPLTDDFNGPQMTGGGIYEANIRDGRRDSTSVAYLHRGGRRANLVIERHAQVQRVCVNAESRAHAVEVVQHGQARRFEARREIILCAGAVDSPKLLQLSGIGDGAQLQALGIPVVHHLPSVGRRLQDHLAVWYTFRVNRPTLNDSLGSWWGQGWAGLQYLLSKRGPLSLSVNQAGGFFSAHPPTAQGSLKDPLAPPELQVYFNPLSYSAPKNHRDAVRPDPFSGILVGFNACRPTSRGDIRLASPRADVPALIDPNYLATAHDCQEALAGSQWIRQLMQAPMLRQRVEQEVTPGPDIQTDEALLQHFRAASSSIYHLCGSCAMGPDREQAVVDASLRVHGVQGLRVMDAAIFPNITSGNIQAAVMMVAERGARLVLETP